MDTLTIDPVTDKVFELTKQFNKYVFEHPDILDQIPTPSALVFLDPNDPDFNRANIELARNTPHLPGPLIYIEMRKQVRIVEQVEWTPQITSTPLAV
jgi:hypothetical protein